MRPDTVPHAESAAASTCATARVSAPCRPGGGGGGGGGARGGGGGEEEERAARTAAAFRLLQEPMLRPKQPVQHPPAPHRRRPLLFRAARARQRAARADVAVGKMAQAKARLLKLLPDLVRDRVRVLLFSL